MKALKIAVIDTETASLSGAVYDIGVVITNKKGEIMQTYNALVHEVVTNPKLMMGAFYAGKTFSHYIPMIASGEVKIKPWATIHAELRELLADVDVVSAYNLAFDRRVIKQTSEMFGTGSIFSRPVKQLDIWRFACQTLLNQKLYKQLAKGERWVSEAGNIKSGAEVAYRFITGKWYFVEDHTALSDCFIETEILARCYAAKKSVPYNKVDDKYHGAPWRLIQG